jgi:hypothetical protein
MTLSGFGSSGTAKMGMLAETTIKPHYSHKNDYNLYRDFEIDSITYLPRFELASYETWPDFPLVETTVQSVRRPR